MARRPRTSPPPPPEPPDDESRTATPRLRFPEFRGAGGWPSTYLGAVLSEHGLKSDGTAEVHSVSLSRGVVPQVEHMGRSFAAADTSHYTLVRPLDVVYTRSPLATFRLGIVKQHRGPHNAIVSPLYGVFAPVNQHVGQLLEAYFEAPARSIRYLEPLAQKGAKNTIQLSNDRFLSSHIYLPPDVDEQAKIAACLTSLDELIAAQGRKVEALKAHKKGLMQHLFPREGETRPRLRFPEFRKAGEWETKSLGTMGEFFRGLTYGAGDTADGGLLVLRSGNIQSGRLVLDSDLVFVRKECPAELQLRLGDVVICMSNGSKALVGKAAEYHGGYTGDLTAGAFCSIYRSPLPFARLVFSTPKYEEFVALGIAGGNINNLKNSDLHAFEVALPPDPAEQERIADCLASIDATIAAESAALAALRTHKAGLMQQLFPAVTSPEPTP